MLFRELHVVFFYKPFKHKPHPATDFNGQLNYAVNKKKKKIMNGFDCDKQYCYLSGCATTTSLRLWLEFMVGLGVSISFLGYTIVICPKKELYNLPLDGKILRLEH